MPKIDDVTGLIRSIGERDYSRAKQYIEIMIGNERNNGRPGAVMQLERALKTWGDNNSKLVELPNNIKSMLYHDDSTRNISEVFLSSPVKEAVSYFLYERQNGTELKDAGLLIRNRVLLAGPPGNGKTTLAAAISNELNLPLYTLKLPEVIDSYMGKTSNKISQIFEYAFINRCVIFLDEIDAIGRVRGGVSDGSSREYSLIVNTLLTCMDRVPDTTVIIGATNMPDLLDKALVRRFNLKLWLDNPSPEDISEYLAAYMDTHAVCFDAQAAALSGQPWSKIEEYCIEQHRSLILGRQGASGVKWIGRG